MLKNRFYLLIVIGFFIILALGVIWKAHIENQQERLLLISHPMAIMGTETTLIDVVNSPKDKRAAEEALLKAEAKLRSVETLMSNWLTESEISVFNRAEASQEMILSKETLDVLKASRKAYDETQGAFDITCRPQIELWKEAGKQNTLPSEEDKRFALEESNWNLIELTDKGAIKKCQTVRVDLGGVAKGYGIDLALDEMKKTGVAGALVDVGGDMACFGTPPEGDGWVIDVKSPFGEGHPKYPTGFLGRIQIQEGAVCTSGNYARYVEIEGKRYSHIIDPRIGIPADVVPSVTVIAPKTVDADIWATALSVLGPEGLKNLPQGIEAMLIMGTSEEFQQFSTPNFPPYFYPQAH